MKTYILKSCSSFHRRRCISSILSFNFNRDKHLAVKEKQNVDIPNKLSTLYVPGRYSGKIYQIVKPIIDVNYIEKTLAATERSCQLRGIELDKDLLPLLKEWEVLKTAHSELAAKDREYIQEKNRLLSLNLATELEKLTLEQNAHIENLRKIRNKVYDLEDVVMPLVLAIPNSVSDFTPRDDDVVEDVIGIPGNVIAASHVEIGKSMGMLEFSDVSPTAYYLKGKFAELEMLAQDYFYDRLRVLGYSPMSCTDFCKSFIVEAIGLDPHSLEDCIPLKPKEARDVGQKLNLVGGASFASFCAYLTNMNVAERTLPSKYFSFGRCYNARNRTHLDIKKMRLDLFSVVQSSNFHLLLLCHEAEEENEFDTVFETLVSMYRTFGMPFRTVDVAVKNLNKTERRKKRIELWSPSRREFVPVSWMSARGDFVSKRLNISFGEECRIRGYCSIIEGVAVNIPVLIGCIVENFQHENQMFDYPQVLKS